MEELLILGDGSLIQGIIILPFAINGLLLVIKGAFAYLEKVEQKYTFNKNWQIGAFGAINLLSYLGFLHAVTKFL